MTIAFLDLAAISGMSDCSLNCGLANVQQSPVTKSTGYDSMDNCYYESTPFSAKDKLSLSFYLNERRRDFDKTSGLELRSSPTLTNS